MQAYALSRHEVSEPRSLTLLDLMALVAGVAVGFAWPSPSLIGPGIGQVPGWVVVALLVFWVLRVGCLGTGFVIVTRRFRYGGMPSPPEWLAILIGLTILVEFLPGVDDVVNATWRPLALGSVSDSNCRWLWAGVGLGTSLVLIGAVLLGRGRLPAGVRALMVILAALVLLWGPLPVMAQELPYLPFWSVNPPLPPADYRWFRAGLGLREGVAQFPTALLFTLPGVATWLAYRRQGVRMWTWPEWVGAVSGSLISVGGIVYFGAIMGTVIFSGALDEYVRILIWPVAAGLSIVIVHRLGPAWNRRIGSGYDRHQSTPATPEG